MARAAIREDLYAAHAGAHRRRAGRGRGRAPRPEQRYQAWEEQEPRAGDRARTTLEEIQGSEEFDLASLSVAMRTIRTLLRTHH